MLIPLSDRASELGAEIGIIGGSGFYEFIDDGVEVEIDTPFGSPAAAVTIGDVAGRRVAFLPRHGRRHAYAAHRVPYRANIWAMASLGIRAVIGPCSCGSLQPGVRPGDFVVVDQLVDRTTGRAGTYHDVGAPEGTPGSEGSVHHQAFADPYDAALRAQLVRSATATGATVRDGGTMVIIDGPRFSTRAESAWYRAMGGTVVNMTGAPEAALAAEAGIPYATVALVTDDDAGIDGHEPVTMDAVLRVMSSNVERLRDVLAHAIPEIIVT
ncbi:MAG: S-methyl-5'-thioadenosine phosphorylase [Ilumatobacteraceae bacterium]